MTGLVVGILHNQAAPFVDVHVGCSVDDASVPFVQRIVVVEVEVFVWLVKILHVEELSPSAVAVIVILACRGIVQCGRLHSCLRERSFQHPYRFDGVGIDVGEGIAILKCAASQSFQSTGETYLFEGRTIAKSIDPNKFQSYGENDFCQMVATLEFVTYSISIDSN